MFVQRRISTIQSAVAGGLIFGRAAVAMAFERGQIDPPLTQWMLRSLRRLPESGQCMADARAAAS